MQRFFEDAQIGGELQHPRITQIYESEQFSDKRPFFAMKLVKGDTLSKLLADRDDAAADRGRFMGNFEQISQTMENRMQTSDLKVLSGLSRQLVSRIVVATIVSGTLFAGTSLHADDKNTVPFTIERTVMTKGYDGTKCWVHARAGIIPATVAESPPTVVVTTQPLMITGSDVFYALNSSFSRDLGRTWSPLVPQDAFERQRIDDRREETICDFTPAWHQATGKLLGTGQTVQYQDNKVMDVRTRHTAWSVYDPKTHVWSQPTHLKMPEDVRFVNCGAGSVQRFDLPNGDILLPVYFKDPTKTQYSVAVCRCGFDGNELRYIEHGTELTIDVKRGLYEPSVTKFGNHFFLTLRNDDHGYVTSSTDGLHYDEPQRWTFDDGSDLGNYNTQQHWVTHPDGLFLVYTRKGASNDHVFRHRAPLFIAQVNPDKRQIIRSTEQILVPERGARLGNFGVAQITHDETWVVVTEWMQTWGPSYVMPVDNKYGADNSIHIAKIKWKNAASDAK